MSAADLATDLVLRWGVTYTRDLDAPSADERLHELASDLHEQLAHERAARRPEVFIAASVLRRAVAGAGADLGWRRDVLRRRLPRVARMRLAASHAVVALSIALAAGLSVLGVLTYGRAAAWTADSGAINIPGSLYAVIPLTLLAVTALALLCARRTRDLGCLLLLAPALLLPLTALHVLTTTSLTVAALTLTNPAAWDGRAGALSVVFAVPVCLALARRVIRGRVVTAERITP